MPGVHGTDFSYGTGSRLAGAGWVAPAAAHLNACGDVMHAVGSVAVRGKSWGAVTVAQPRCPYLHLTSDHIPAVQSGLDSTASKALVVALQASAGALWSMAVLCQA